MSPVSISPSSCVRTGPAATSAYTVRLDQDTEYHAEDEEEAVALEDTEIYGGQDDAETNKYLESRLTLQISTQRRGVGRHFSFARRSV